MIFYDSKVTQHILKPMVYIRIKKVLWLSSNQINYRTYSFDHTAIGCFTKYVVNVSHGNNNALHNHKSDTINYVQGT